jgi:hypothetical protein
MSPLDAAHKSTEVEETAVTNGLVRPKVLYIKLKLFLCSFQPYSLFRNILPEQDLYANVTKKPGVGVIHVL